MVRSNPLASRVVRSTTFLTLLLFLPILTEAQADLWLARRRHHGSVYVRRPGRQRGCRQGWARAGDLPGVFRTS